MRQKWGEKANIENIPVTVERLRKYKFENLLWRRKEIVEIIRDHPYCTFDFIYRRFVNQVGSKSVHNDLLILQVMGFIHKAGKTRGTLYVANT